MKTQLIMHRATVWTAERMRFGVLAAAVGTAALVPVYRSQSLSWMEAAIAAAMFVVPCVALGLVTWHLFMRARPAVATWRTVALHAGCALAFSFTWTSIFTGFVYLARPEGVGGFLRDGAIWQLVWGLVIYLAIAQLARTRIRLREREVATANAELQALRSQLNPHFLFNTLHSLGQLAREDPVATEEALEKFGELMRYALDAGSSRATEVPLEAEMRFIRGYLTLEGLRLGERLRYVETIEPHALRSAVPPLLLQPLVENAVRHGVAPKRDGATIRLAARVADSTLTIEVADDGNGASPDSWRHASGMGLKSVVRQLEAGFGGTARMQVTARPQKGFSVRLEMPARAAGET